MELLDKITTARQIITRAEIERMCLLSAKKTRDGIFEDLEKDFNVVCKEVDLKLADEGDCNTRCRNYREFKAKWDIEVK